MAEFPTRDDVEIAVVVAMDNHGGESFQELAANAVMPLLDQARKAVAKEIAHAIRDHPGPDPTPARPAWWEGYLECQMDAVTIAYRHANEVRE